ncbi:MAG: galactose-1-epimerase, partial [Armatimonadota bacterium]
MTLRRFGLPLVGVFACCVLLVSCKKQVPQVEGPEPGSTRDVGDMALTAEVESYGTLEDGTEVDIYTLTNANGMRVKLINYGALTVSVEVPDAEGNLTDVTLGYDTLDGWLTNTSYFGATVGRYANRIAKGKFTLDGETYTLATNNGENHLHGGIKGFDKVVWEAETVDVDGAVGVQFT